MKLHSFTREEFERDIYGEPIPDWLWEYLRSNYERGF